MITGSEPFPPAGEKGRPAINAAGRSGGPTNRAQKERCVIMKSINIKLSLAENVKTFVNTVNRYPYDMDLRAGRHVVDAKSILGIFSLDLSKPVELQADCEETDEFVTKIESYIVR